MNRRPRGARRARRPPIATLAILAIALFAADPARRANGQVESASERDALVPARLETNPPFGPAPRTEDGRYTNLVGDIGHGTLGTRLSFFARRLAATVTGRSGAPERLGEADASARLAAASDGGAPTITWIGHSTMLVQMDGVRFLTDPTWSSTASPFDPVGPRRFVDPGLPIEALPPIDFVVISHNHYDHLDLGTLRALGRHDARTRFFVPAGNGPLLRGEGLEHVVEFDWGEAVEWQGVRIRAVPSQHWSKRSLFDDLETLWAAWSIEGPTRRFFFAGDTGFFDGFARIGEALGPYDLAALPIGAYAPEAMMRESHMDPEEAVRAGQALRARRMIGMHFGTFDLTDEPLTEPPLRFDAAARAAGLDADAAWVFRVGETRRF